ncbi:MAG: hypothetical protein IID54_06135 [Proteobacteria bacterium]|nr:hypothetical protein [Pseudomonadota bacterium]
MKKNGISYGNKTHYQHHGGWFARNGYVCLIIDTLPLPVSDETPADPLIGRTNPPIIGFTVDENFPGLDRLACFASGEGKVAMERLGATRFEIRPAQAFRQGRTRINCTLPAADGRFRWMGRQYYLPKRAGQ